MCSARDVGNEGNRCAKFAQRLGEGQNCTSDDTRQDQWKRDRGKDAQTRRSELASFRCLTPLDAGHRGSQVSLAHEHGYAIAQALIEQGIIVDFRAPDIVRFGFAPLYNRFADVARALAALSDVMASERYLESRFSERARVT